MSGDFPHSNAYVLNSAITFLISLSHCVLFIRSQALSTVPHKGRGSKLYFCGHILKPTHHTCWVSSSHTGYSFPTSSPSLHFQRSASDPVFSFICILSSPSAFNTPTCRLCKPGISCPRLSLSLGHMKLNS